MGRSGDGGSNDGGRSSGGRSSGGFSGGGRSSGGFSGGRSSGGRSYGSATGSSSPSQPSGSQAQPSRRPNSAPSGPPPERRPPRGGFHHRRRRDPQIVPVVIETSGRRYDQGAYATGPAEAPEPIDPAARRRKRRWILIAIAALLLLSGFSGLVSSCAGFHIDGTPIIERTALSAGSVSETGYYTDEDGGWIHDASKMESGLRTFYQKTGVQPYVYILPNGSSADLVAFAESNYDKLFSDEGHFLLVFCDDGEGGFDCGFAMGDKVTPIMDDAAIDVLAGNLDKYYRNRSISEEEIFSKAFADTGETIMAKDTYFAGSLMCIAIVLVPALVYVGVRVFRARREQEERDRKLQEEILRTPLEKFGDEEVEELAKKYASDAPQAATPAATPAAVPVAPVPVSAAAPAAASVADEFDQGAATSPAMPARGDTSPDAHE